MLQLWILCHCARLSLVLLLLQTVAANKYLLMYRELFFFSESFFCLIYGRLTYLTAILTERFRSQLGTLKTYCVKAWILP